MKNKIAIIDYGVGNLLSVTKALSYLGLTNFITSDAKEIEKAAAIILPGVGAFPKAMNNLQQRGLDKILVYQSQKKPFLGICLGMQLLFSRSFEIKESMGLGLIEGDVRQIKTNLKLPQIGWNNLSIKKDSPLLAGLPENSYVYFVHSFCAVPAQNQNLAATTTYGEEIAAVVEKDNIFGCQFHPEKSSEVGLVILKNFGGLIK